MGHSIKPIIFKLQGSHRMDTYCKIFVQGTSSSGALRELVADIFKGTARRRTIGWSGLDVYINDNDECDPLQDALKEVEFLFFPYFLDVDSIGPVVSWVEYLSSVESLLDGLRSGGQVFATVADFESQLRDCGAYPPVALNKHVGWVGILWSITSGTVEYYYGQFNSK